jgi:nucleotide-binding universal stress UspA family protein
VSALAGDAQSHLLPNALELGSDLIVMGDSAKSLLTHRVFGDTALHVIRSAECPLFLSH